MPDFDRTEPALCDHRQAPWIPLCEHAGRVRAMDLTDADVGRVITARDGTGVLTAVRHIDETATQIALRRGHDDADLITTGAGEVLRIGWPAAEGDEGAA